MADFQNRIKYKGEISTVLVDVCKAFQLGDYQDHDVLEIGYEDFNLILTSSKGTYFVKVFASYRTKQEIDRYVEIMKNVVEVNIAHPSLYSMSDGDMLFSREYSSGSIELVVMEYISGKNMYETQEKLNKKDVRYLTQQAARISQLDIDPIEVYDEWSVVNIKKEFPQIEHKLSGKNKEIAASAYKEIEDKLNFKELPWCFVHGDLTRSNLIREKETIRIIDFSVSNVNPRIQELAVLFCNTFFDPDRIEWSTEMYDLMLEEYQKDVILEEIEIIKLPLYVKAGFLTNIIGTTKVDEVEVDTNENNYWMRLGYSGLEKFSLDNYKK